MTMIHEEDLFRLADRDCIPLNTADAATLTALRQRAREAGYRGVPWDDTASLLNVIRRYAQAIQAYVQGREQLLQACLKPVTRKGRGVQDAQAAMAGEQVALVAWVVALTPALDTQGRQNLVDLYMAWQAGRAEGFGACMAMIQTQLAHKPTATLMRLWHRMVIPARHSLQASAALSAPPTPTVVRSPQPAATANPKAKGLHQKRGIEAALGFVK